jgi:hypothetical protein
MPRVELDRANKAEGECWGKRDYEGGRIDRRGQRAYM